MHYVLLTDNDNATAMIGCPDAETADTVAAAAVFSDGGVSAWLVPDGCFTSTQEIITMLRDGADCDDLHNRGFGVTPITIKEDK